MHSRIQKIALIFLTVLILFGVLPSGTSASQSGSAAQITAQQLDLGDDLTMHFYGTVSSEYVADAVVNITVGGKEAASYIVKDMTPEENGTYRFSVDLGAPEMTENITLTVTAGENTLLQNTYSIQAYARYLLEGDATEETKALLKEMLNYGAKAQIYFDHKTDDLANAGYEIDAQAVIPSDAPEVTVADDLPGIIYHGTSMVFESKLALRYYFLTLKGVEGYTFTVDGIPYTPIPKDDYYYIEVSGISPDQMDAQMEIAVTGDSGRLSFRYCPMTFISRMYHKDTSSDALKNLLLAASRYFAAAEVYTDPLAAMVNKMTTEEKVGQLFLARCPDINALEDISTYHLGGYILFGRDFEDKTPAQVISTIGSYQEAAAIPMLIAVDEEGGTVCRVSSHSQFRESRFPSPRRLYEQGGLELIFQTETEKCQMLKGLGINVNVSPVCDITTDPDAFMYSRSLGQSPEETGRFVAGLVGVMQENQLGGILKHFPGYGNNTDTHTGIAVDNRSLEELESADLIPFAAGIDAGCGAILISHTFINCLDTVYPASLSPAVHQYLRETMGFDGVIVTDDLVMQAITDLYGAEEAAVLAVLAGNDLLCSTEYQVQYDAVLEAVKSGRISQAQLEQSVRRVLQWKYDLGLVPD